MPQDKAVRSNSDPRTKPEALSPETPSLEPGESVRQLRSFWLATLGLVLCFGMPLWNLVWFAADSELYSYILLIPFISGYLVWQNRRSLPPGSPPARKAAVGFLLAGTVVMVVYWLFLRSRWKLAEDDYLAVMMVSFLLFFFGAGCLFLGRARLRAVLFPLGFLIFMVPLPAAVVGGIESFLQSGSAAVAQGFFRLAGTPFLQDGLVFQLPGITIQIARECSGIHSSLALFITSLLASYLLLRTPWKRAVFILAVIPLGILRNGFRVFTIGELCVHIGPHMVDSPIHHKGGPIFFVLSLLPLGLLLVLLYKSERAREKAKLTTPE